MKYLYGPSEKLGADGLMAGMRLAGQPHDKMGFSCKDNNFK